MASFGEQRASWQSNATQPSSSQLVALNSVSLYSSTLGAAPQLISTAQLSIVLHPAEVRAEVGGVSWRLGADVPCLCNDSHAYTFAPPDQPGTYLTIVLNPSTSQQDISLLQTVLINTTGYQAHAALPPGSTASAPGAPTVEVTGTVEEDKYEKVARGLRKGGSLLGAGLVVAAKYAGAGLKASADLAVKHLAPAGGAPVRVSPETQARLENARRVAGRAGAVSGKVVEVVAGATMAIASQLAGHISRSSLVQDAMKKGFGGGGGDGAQRVGKAGLLALHEVFQGMEAAGDLVLASAKEAATRVVHHKYGAEAAAAAHEGMGAAGGVVEVGRNLNMLRPSKITQQAIKHTVKHTAVSVMQTDGAPAAEAAAAAPSGAAADCSSVQQQQQQQQQVQYQAAVGVPVAAPAAPGGMAIGVPLQQQAQQQGVQMVGGVEAYTYEYNTTTTTAVGAPSVFGAGAPGAPTAAPAGSRYYPPVPVMAPLNPAPRK